ncbi:MAG: citrate lyase beta subunit [SAR324 cluster bacterium]|nr:citrate lyase beta subunit [SAR324 cluster bacterium]
MNVIEKKIISVLKELKEDFGVIEIKAEFEAEGSRVDEMMRLKDVTASAGLPVLLKIGGVEAITDIYIGLSLGVQGLNAPMAETPFALQKYLSAIKTFIPEDNREELSCSFNLETITACNNLDDMLALEDISFLDGMTIGRVDLTGSLYKGRDYIESEEVFQLCHTAFTKARAKGLRCAMGGGISTEALPNVQRLVDEKLIDKYETRKIVFSADSVKYGEKAILKAVEFELLWLQSKQRFYSRAATEDANRIVMLQKRLDA